MDRINRLLFKAKPKPSLHDKLKENNPFWGKDFRELLDYMGPEPRVPENGTILKDKFNYALIDAFCRMRTESRGVDSGKSSIKNKDTDRNQTDAYTCDEHGR